MTLNSVAEDTGTRGVVQVEDVRLFLAAVDLLLIKCLQLLSQILTASPDILHCTLRNLKIYIKLG